MPTPEWIKKNEVEWYGDDRETKKRIGLKHPTRLHELCARGVIDEMQRHYGIRLSVLYVRAGRPQLRAQALYDSPRGGSREHSLNNAVDAFCLYLNCQHELQNYWPVLHKVCLDEMTLDDLSLELSRRRQAMPEVIRGALNELGEWLYKQEPGSV